MESKRKQDLEDEMNRYALIIRNHQIQSESEQTLL